MPVLCGVCGLNSTSGFFFVRFVLAFLRDMKGNDGLTLTLKSSVRQVTSLMCWGYPYLNGMSFLKSAGLSIPPLLGVGHGAMHRECLKSRKSILSCAPFHL